MLSDRTIFKKKIIKKKKNLKNMINFFETALKDKNTVLAIETQQTNQTEKVTTY